MGRLGRPGSTEPGARTKATFKLDLAGTLVKVGAKVTGKLGLQVLPDYGWMNSSARVFPITIDPTYASATGSLIYDGFVVEGASDDRSTESRLKIGNNGGTQNLAVRTYLTFDNTPIIGKKIVSASLSLFNAYARTCSARTWTAYNSGSATAATRWANQPTTFSQYATSSQGKGDTGCPGGNVSIDMKTQLQSWADATGTTKSMLLKTNETDVSYWKEFSSSESSQPPVLRYTYNRAPGTPALPYHNPHAWYDPDGAGSGPAILYTANTTLNLKAGTGNDADGNTVRNEYAVFANATSTTSPLASCNTAYVTAGAAATCTLPALTANTSVWARARSFDGTARSSWTAAREWRLAPGAPLAPPVVCPAPYSNNSWTATAPASNVTCTITGTGSGYSAPSMIRYSVDNGPWTDAPITQSTSASVAKVTVSVKNTSGGHSVRAYAATPAGTLSGLALHSFGYGATPSLQTPAAAPRVTTAGRLPIAAEGQPQGGAAAVTAAVRWRVAGTTSWADAPAGSAPLTVTQKNGKSVVAGSFGVEALGGVADSAGIVVNDRTPTLVDVQVCLSYDTTSQCTAGVTVLRVPHAFGAGFPEADAGPGKVGLWTGELQVDDSDASLATPSGGVAVSRTHSSFGGVGTTQSGVFGPGWVASFDDGADGFGGAQVFDSTRVDGTLAVVDADGSALVFTTPTGNRRSTTTADLPTGTYLPADEDTDLSGVTAKISGTGTATVLELTDEDGVITKFGVRAAPAAGVDATFKTLEVRDTVVADKTTYAYDTAGRVTAIVAPLPDGVTTCVPGTATAGCRVLKISYATATTATASTPGDYQNQVKEIRAQVNTDADKILAAYTYDTAGQLVTAKDSRTNLTTAYTWTGTGTSLRLATITPSGQAPFTFTYAGDKVATVTRPNPATAGGGTAQLAGFVYDLPLTGAGLPDLRYDQADATVGVSRWGQTSAPTWGAAVFGPDKPINGTTPAAITDPADWAYADLQYTDAEGYTLNTAAYGAGGWQLTATEYDTLGNPIRNWDERATRALIDGTITAARATDVATLTVYNNDITSGEVVVTPAGTLVTDTYGPVHDVVGASGDLEPLRTHTTSNYDQGAPTPA